MSGRHQPEEGADSARAIAVSQTEAAFQKQVTDLATYQGWKWMHVENRAGNSDGTGWHTPIKGPLAKGFPDMILVRGRTLLFVELKSERGILSEHQKARLQDLQWCALTYVWRPSDWAQIAEVLANA